MSYPSNLIDAYAAIRETALVRQADTSSTALAEFARHLNAAQKDAQTSPIYKTVQSLYRANRRGYISCIRNTTNESTVLWTDARAVTSWFELSRLIYIKYREGRFWVRAIAHDHPPARRVEKTEDLDLAFPEIKGNELVLKQ